MPHRSTRRRTTALLAAGAFGAASLAAVGTAGAHVTAGIDAIEGTTSTVVFSFDHGCDGAATTGIEALFPSSTTDVDPVDEDGWTSNVDETDAGVVVSWTGGSVPDHTAMSFTVNVTFGEPDGTRVLLPTIQSCGDDELAWIDPDAEASYPAPAVIVGQTGSAPGGHSHGDDDNGHAGDEGDEGHDDAADDTTTTDDAADDTTTDDETDGDEPEPLVAEAETTAEEASDIGQGANAGGTAGLIVLIVVVVIIVGGATTLYLRNRGSSPPPAD
ncbi:MAG: DUF1775 domain-containing protein [Acidimicrobiia bacterium]|nr:DUF1775 domain-containing protein [Acidimicrobiia bacterium]